MERKRQALNKTFQDNQHHISEIEKNYEEFMQKEASMNKKLNQMKTYLKSDSYKNLMCVGTNLVDKKPDYQPLSQKSIKTTDKSNLFIEGRGLSHVNDNQNSKKSIEQHKSLKNKTRSVTKSPKSDISKQTVISKDQLLKPLDNDDISGKLNIIKQLINDQKSTNMEPSKKDPNKKSINTELSEPDQSEKMTNLEEPTQKSNKKKTYTKMTKGNNVLEVENVLVGPEPKQILLNIGMSCKLCKHKYCTVIKILNGDELEFINDRKEKKAQNLEPSTKKVVNREELLLKIPFGKFFSANLLENNVENSQSKKDQKDNRKRWTDTRIIKDKKTKLKKTREPRSNVESTFAEHPDILNKLFNKNL